MSHNRPFALWILFIAIFGALASTTTVAAKEPPAPTLEPPFQTVDLDIGESREVKLSNGRTVSVKLLALKEIRDEPRQAIREARATVEIDGQKTTLSAANYHLPVTVGEVQIDCAVTQGYVKNARKDRRNSWALEKDARLRLWPAGSPWIQPGTFAYPAAQRWFANHTQMSNEPTYVDGGEDPANSSIYYHYGLDLGGSEGQVEVLSATDGFVVAAGEESVDPSEYPDVLRKRYDDVFIRDARGWYHCYAHLMSIDPAVKPGATVKMGQKIGILGKEGGSGGWSHLHYGILGLQPSGQWGTVEGYAFLWQAYHEAHQTLLQAVARPHHLTWAGDEVTFDATRSWSHRGPRHIASYQWMFSDGTKAEGPKAGHVYNAPGEYCETLKVTDAEGRVDYDFAVVLVLDREHPELLPPTIHAAYWPTFDLKPGTEITFKVRSFGVGPTEGKERWDFGDGSPTVEVQSLPAGKDPATGKSMTLAKDGYAITTHRYAKPGRYMVSVSRTNDRGETATARLHIVIEP